MIKLYKDGNVMGMLTDCGDENTFIQEISEMFDLLINEGKYEGDWAFQFNEWLEQIVDICCKYRGYKNEVKEERLLIAGSGYPHAPLVAKLDDRGKNGLQFESVVEAAEAELKENNVSDKKK